MLQKIYYNFQSFLIINWNTYYKLKFLELRSLKKKWSCFVNDDSFLPKKKIKRE